MKFNSDDNHSTDLHFSDYIRMLPNSWVLDHFLKKPDGARKIVSSSAIQERIEHFSTAESLHEQYYALNSSLQLHCALAYLMGRMGVGALQSKVDLEDPLVYSALVYAARNKNGSVRYFGFPEFAKLLQPLMAKRLADEAAVNAAASPPAPMPRFHLNDIVVVAALASQGVLSLTKLGKLTRASLQRIAKLIHGASAFREPADGAELLAGYCLHLGILSTCQERYACAADVLEEWLSRPVSERRAELAGFAVASTHSWGLDLLAEASRIAPGSWLSFSVFPEKEKKNADETLRVLHWAGSAEIIETESGMTFGAVRSVHAIASSHHVPASETTGSILVLPDFTAVIPEESSPEQLYRFGRLGSFQSLDRVYKGTIGRAIINDSLARGCSGDAVLAWLGEWGAPSNVLATVREWIREFYRLYVTEGELVVATDEKVAFQISEYEPLRSLLTPMPVYKLFRIRRGAEAGVKEILAGIGYDYRMPDRTRSHGEPSPAQESNAPEAQWTPIVKEEERAHAGTVTLRGKKYGAGLKQLDLNETMHIIDYAILTGQRLVIEYAGSPLVKRGVYTVLPKSCIKGPELLLEATANNGQQKQFIAKKISKIGVDVG